MKLAPLLQHEWLGDPAMTGEWAEVLPGIAADAGPPPWCAYMAANGDQKVGVGLFKGPPDTKNRVEIAYLTFFPNEGRGVATAIAGELVRVAREFGASRVLAHTLRETNASNRVLEKNGFHFTGEVLDPEDGSVWRWELAL